MSGPDSKRAVSVFINYRRSDVAGHAGRLYDALSQRLGADRVFMDIDTIPVGVDFSEVVRDALDHCDILLALIGKQWSDARNRSGQRRLDLPDDYVRIELETALAQRIPILPILVQDAEMPSERELPASLSLLARVNALEISDRRWRRDIEVLYEHLAPGDALEPDAGAGEPLEPASEPARDVRKLVSVVLADLSAAEGRGDRDPEAFDSARRRSFDAAQAAVERHGGLVQRFLEDSVVGVFGVPVAHEDDALRATRAASELLDIVTRPAAADLHEALEARVVVLTDETVIRADPASNLTAGDLVGRAVRLQYGAEPNTILLSETTYRLVQSEVEAHEHDRARSGDARVYELEHVRRVDEATSPTAGIPLIGRGRELRILERLVDDCVADETCALVTLLGEAGIGKTRIVTALASHLGESARVVVGRCASYGEGITFLPVAQIVEALAGIDRSDPPDIVRVKLDATAERFGLPPVSAVGLARLVGNEPPAGEIEETFWAFRSILEGFAHERPLVVVFEDLHWADEAVFEVIEHVSDWSTGAPLLIVATARPDLLDRRPEWAGGKRHTTTRTLQPLGPAAARELLAALPHGAALPEPVAGRLLEAAGGVPLFVEEVLAALVQRSPTTSDDAPAAIPTNVVMPDSLSALLEARIDQLTPAERTVLQCASIVGDSVGMAPLIALTELDASVVRDLATALVRRDILTIAEGDERAPTTVQCRHALLREAAYRSLTKHERARLHEAFVEWLDADPATTAEQREPLVARQLELAITTSREIGRATTAGVARRATAAFNAIIDDANGRGRAPGELLTRIEQLAARDATMRVGLGPRLASALADNGDCETAATIVADWSTGNAGSVQWQLAEAALRTARLSTGDYEAATAILDRLATSEPPLEPADEIEALHHRGFLESQFGQRAAAVTDFTRAAAIARAESFTHYEIRALRHLVTSAAYGPTPVDEVARILDDVSGRMEQLGSRPAAIARGVALLAAMRGDTDLARSALRDYFDLEQTYGLSRHLASHGQDVYDIEWWAGDLDAARIALEASDKQLRLMGADNYRTTVLAQLSRVLARQGRLDEAISAASEAQRLVEPYDSDSLVLLHSAFANAYARIGRAEEAIVAGHDAIAVETDCLLDRGEAFLSYGEALARAGRVDEAGVAVRQAVDCFERKGALAPLRTTKAALERLERDASWPSD